MASAGSNNGISLDSSTDHMVAIENSVPEVIHVMNVTSSPSGSSSTVTGASAASSALNLSSLSASSLAQLQQQQASNQSGIHTITISAGNLTFPVTLATNPVLQNATTVSQAGSQQPTQIVMATPELASRLKDMLPAAQLGLTPGPIFDVAAKLKVCVNQN